MLWLILLMIICVLIYIIGIRPLSRWKKRKVPYKTPLPFVGNFWKLVSRQQSFYETFNDLYNDFPNLRYNGIFQFTEASLLIRDLELIKQIAVKDFDHFTDHRDIGSSDVDEILSKNLGQLNGQDWRDMRATLSPAFTSSKMKTMFLLISECAQQMADHFSGIENIQEIELKELFTRYTNDVIATCAFGVKCDSLREKENSFFMMGRDLSSFKGLRGVKMVLANFAPGILRSLRMSIFPKYLTDFFFNVIKETIAYRLENNVIRPDMIHLLLEARKGKLKHEEVIDEDPGDKGFAIIEESGIGKQQVKQVELTDLDIAAQAFVFFFAGFEPTSLMLSFTCTELAINTDVQEKLFAEVDAVMKKCNGKPAYEDITGMKYLDMVVSETLRKWPAAPVTDRKCTKAFTIKATSPGEEDYEIKYNDHIFIPILPIHRDEKYYPNPEKFDPERFSDENKHKIVPFSYLPFGVGPRACIGSRFALLEIKVLLVYMLWKFEFVPVAKTSIPIKLTAKTIRTQPSDGFWLGLKPR